MTKNLGYFNYCGYTCSGGPSRSETKLEIRIENSKYIVSNKWLEYIDGNVDDYGNIQMKFDNIKSLVIYVIKKLKSCLTHALYLFEDEDHVKYIQFNNSWTGLIPIIEDGYEEEVLETYGIDSINELLDLDSHQISLDLEFDEKLLSYIKEGFYKYDKDSELKDLNFKEFISTIDMVKQYLKENCDKWGDLTDEQWVELEESIGVKRVNYVNIDDIADETPFRYCMEVHFLLIDGKLYCHHVFNGEYTTMEGDYDGLEIWEREFLEQNGFNKNRFEEEEPHIEFEGLI